MVTIRHLLTRASILVAVFLSFSIDLSAQIQQLTKQQVTEILLDETTSNEFREMREGFMLGMEAIEAQRTKEETVTLALDYFFKDKMSNEELWEILDDIKLNLYNPIYIYEDYLKTISPKSSSSLSYYIPFYNLLFEISYDLNDYQRREAGILNSSIEALELGDIDLYDQYTARSALLNAEFMTLYANVQEVGLQMVPKGSISYYLAQTEIRVARIASEAMKLSALMLLEELDNTIIRASLRLVDRLEKSQRNIEEENLLESMRSFYELTKKLYDPIEKSEYMAKVDQLQAFSVSCFRANLSLAKTYAEMARLFGSVNYEDKYYNVIDALNMRIENERALSIKACEQSEIELIEMQDYVVDRIRTR